MICFRIGRTRYCASHLLLKVPLFCLLGVQNHATADVFQAPLPVLPEDFQLRCYVTDPATGQGITSLIPGDLARASAAVKLGETIMARKATIIGSASVSVYGYDLKLQLGHTVLEIPPMDQRDALLELYSSEPRTWPASYGQRFISDFTVPNKWPRSQVTVKLVAKIDGVGSRTCTKTLDIQ